MTPAENAGMGRFAAEFAKCSCQTFMSLLGTPRNKFKPCALYKARAPSKLEGPCGFAIGCNLI